MKRLQNTHFGLLLLVVFGLLASRLGDSSIKAEDFYTSSSAAIITDCFATGYYCVYDCELEGTQVVTRTISNNTYTLKASFLFGGAGVVMQGTGKISPDGDYIKYTGGGGCFVRIAGPDAGRNLEGQWVVNPQVLRGRYARLGITDFNGFGNLAIARPGRATYSRDFTIAGSAGRNLTSWFSIAVDPSLIPLGQTCTLLFNNNTTMPYGATSANFRADDTGGVIKGNRVDIYLGEGKAAWDQWLQTGGNRYVDIYIDAVPKILASAITPQTPNND